VIGLDTNVLVRYVVQDEPSQAELAIHLIENVCSMDNPGFVTVAVLCEFFWVLKRAYRLDRATICEAVGRLLRSRGIVVEREDVARLAIIDFRAGFDFADALIGHCNEAAGCTVTATFDQKALGLSHFGQVSDVFRTSSH